MKHNCGCFVYNFAVKGCWHFALKCHSKTFCPLCPTSSITDHNDPYAVHNFSSTSSQLFYSRQVDFLEFSVITSTVLCFLVCSLSGLPEHRRKALLSSFSLATIIQFLLADLVDQKVAKLECNLRPSR